MLLDNELSKTRLLMPWQFLKSSPLNPTGFKIALELLLKAPIPRGGIAEIPFSFGTRAVGESKLSSKVNASPPRPTPP
jgi:hypothetical protein